MATSGQIGAQREIAMRRIVQAAERMGQQTNVAPPDFRQAFDRDKALQHAKELTLVAEWLERITPPPAIVSGLESLPMPEGDVDFDSMTAQALREYAEAHDINIDGVTRKAELLPIIKAVWG